MKIPFLLTILLSPVWAQYESDMEGPPAKETIEKKQTKNLPESQSAGEKREEQEEASQLGPYDRDGNYQIQIRPKENLPPE